MTNCMSSIYRDKHKSLDHFKKVLHSQQEIILRYNQYVVNAEMTSMTGIHFRKYNIGLPKSYLNYNLSFTKHIG